MAHELMFNDDGKAAMFYVDEVPWHKYGIKLDQPPTAAEAIQAARLDWTLAKAPLFYHRSLTETAVLPDTYAVVPDERWPNREKPVLGVVSGKYEILQNRDAFAFFDPLVTKGYATYETAGALGKGERVWVLAKIKEAIEIGKGDKVERYLLLSNRHDGHGTVNIKFTPIRVVCQNTLTMALQDARQVFAIRHDDDLFSRLGSVADEMYERIVTRYQQIQDHFNTMLEAEIDMDQAAYYFEMVYSDPQYAPAYDEAQKKRRKERLQKLDRARKCCNFILENSKYCRPNKEPVTVWTAYNAVTEFVDHWRSEGLNGMSPTIGLNNIWFGNGHQCKQKAFNEAKTLAHKITNGRT